ncbi:MAG: glycosyltransferase family 4 protein [Ignavibacteriaceae bacterium]
MKFLFVSSGNNKFGIGPIVKAQGESLRNAGIAVEYFTIVGKGFKGYISNIFTLRKFLKVNRFDFVHSHFLLSSIVATLSNPIYLVVSLMGSDAYTSKFWNFLIKLFHKRWDATIVKSERMKEVLGLDDLYVIPNGVDIEKFHPINKQIARQKLGWDEKKYILFASSPDRPEKNYQLAKEAITELKSEVELVTLQDIAHEKIVHYLNAADVLLMTSKYEGSPNIIKEAMACNCPIVTTDVGDVDWVVGKTEGCYLISKNEKLKIKNLETELVKETSDKIQEALNFAENVGRTKGRERIIELGLDSETVAQKIISIYKKVLKTDNDLNGKEIKEHAEKPL